jgi:hypothetical protein
LAANVQKIMVTEDALCYQLAERHHGKTACVTFARMTWPTN